MYRLCHSLVGNSEDAKDSLQLAFVQAFVPFIVLITPVKYQHGCTALLYGLLLQINGAASVVGGDLQVAYDSDKRHLGKTRRPGLEARIAGRELLGLLDGALDKLPEKRTAFILCILQQHSIEVSNLTDASLQTTRILSARDD
ncbi:MAG: hypothetical protein R3C68_09825 [Myxococcota bacterium]